MLFKRIGRLRGEYSSAQLTIIYNLMGFIFHCHLLSSQNTQFHFATSWLERALYTNMRIFDTHSTTSVFWAESLYKVQELKKVEYDVHKWNMRTRVRSKKIYRVQKEQIRNDSSVQRKRTLVVKIRRKSKRRRQGKRGKKQWGIFWWGKGKLEWSRSTGETK